MEQWIEQTESICVPLAGDSVVGEDPRYSDTFSELKSAIERKTDVDFERIRLLSEGILTTEAKDLRVASYLLLSLARLEGLVGIGKGMTILYQLLSQYGEQLHPTKDNARVSAMRWFQQDKILQFAQSANHPVSPEDTTQALQAYDRLFESLSDMSGEPMSWPDLKKWLEAQHKEQQPEPPAMEPQAAQVSRQSSPGTANPAPVGGSESPSGSITSTTQYQQTLRSLMTYHREQSALEKLIGLACASQWCGLPLPPNENGKTRLPAPREASLVRIRNAVDNQQWQEGLLAAVDAFMEPGGQFLLDIMKQAADCAQQMNQREISRIIQSQLQLLVQRQPKLLQLKFENDEPFASSKVIAWLEQTQQQDSSSEPSDGATIVSLLSEARKIADSESVTRALMWLDEQPQSFNLQTINIQFCKAQICVEQDRSNLALPLLLQLEKDTERLQLARTTPGTAMQIWRLLHRLLDERLASVKQDEQRLAMESQMDHLQSLMCTTDVASAIQWL